MAYKQLKEIEDLELFLEFYIKSSNKRTKVDRNIRILNSFLCGTKIDSIATDENVSRSRIAEILKYIWYSNLAYERKKKRDSLI